MRHTKRDQKTKKKQKKNSIINDVHEVRACNKIGSI